MELRNGNNINIEALLDAAIGTPDYFAVKSLVSGLYADENNCIDLYTLLGKARGTDAYTTLIELIYYGDRTKI